MAGGEAGGPAHVPGVGRGGRVAAPHRRRQRRVSNEAGPAAVADLLKFAVPARDRQPDFDLDIGIARGRNCRGHAAERGQIREGRVKRRVRFGRLELPRGNHLRGRDGRVRQPQRREFPAGSRIRAGRSARVNNTARIDGDVRCRQHTHSAKHNPECDYRRDFHLHTSSLSVLVVKSRHSRRESRINAHSLLSRRARRSRRRRRQPNLCWENPPLDEGWGTRKNPVRNCESALRYARVDVAPLRMLQDALRRQGRLPQPRSRRIKNRVGNRRRHADNRRLASAKRTASPGGLSGQFRPPESSGKRTIG